MIDNLSKPKRFGRMNIVISDSLEVNFENKHPKGGYYIFSNNKLAVRILSSGKYFGRRSFQLRHVKQY